MPMAPLKTHTSPRVVSAIIHVIGLSLFAAALSWLPKISNPLHHGFGGPYQFLTFIALTMSATTFGVALLADLTLSKQLFALKNKLSVCATPLEVLIAILYWGLRAFEKRWVVPPGHELPLIPDFGFHGMPAILLTLDMMLLSPPCTIRARDAMMVGFAMVFLYWSWVEYCFSLNGWYPYPLLILLSIWQKLLLGIISVLLMTSSTVALKLLYGHINGVDELRRASFSAVKKY